MEHGPTSEELIAEMAWVRRLARALVRDTSLADDIAQDTWLVADAEQPATDRPLRPWLSRVVANLARTRRRSDSRRDSREALAVTSPLTPTPAELIERVELQRAVADEVLALGEPYRSTVLLHFFEGVSSVELARRLGIPASTVRRRLAVALEQLREALRRRADSPKRGWLAALVPLATSSTPSVMGAIAVKKVVAIAVVIIAALVVGVVWKHRRSPAHEPSVISSPTAPHAFARLRAEGAIPSWLAQAGVAPRRIAGRVVAAGAPIAHASVKLALRVGETVQPITSIATGVDGAFDFGVQPAALFTVSASADHHAPRSLALALADPAVKADQLVIELGDCRSRISGTVHDAGGGPIAHARITRDGLGGTESDAAGHFELCLAQDPLPGIPATNVRAEADGYGTREERVVVGGDLHHDFVLAPEAVLVGRVVVGDQPVVGARVVATPDPSDRVHLLVAGWGDSDADGQFRIGGLAPGKFQLTAISDRFGTATPLLAIAHPAATSRELRLVLTAVARVAGRVVIDGHPVAGAAVDIVGRNQPATSQADGSFVLDHMPYGTITLVAQPYEVARPKVLAVGVASVEGVELEVTKLATLHGHITDKAGSARGAQITCNDASGGHTATADEGGNYVLEGLASVVSCFAWTADNAFADAQQKTLSRTGENTLDFALVFSGRVKGTVLDEAGKPVAAAYLVFELEGDACETVSDANGAFECGTLRGGDYKVTVTPSAGSREPFAAASGDRLPLVHVPSDGVTAGITVAIKNERKAIRGTVVDDTGVAIADVDVELIGHGASNMGLPHTLADNDGKFTIDDLAPGSYSVHAHAADGSETELTGVASGTDNLVITLARPGTIEGTLIGFSTTPTVYTSTITTDLALGGVAIVDGDTFVASGLTPGHYTVHAAAGAESDGQAVDVRSNETTHVTLTSRGLGKVQGRVTDFDTGAPSAGFRCDGNISIGGDMASVPPDPTRQAFTDANGQFLVSAPLGAVRVFCFMFGGGLTSAAGTDVVVSDGLVPNVELVTVRMMFGATPGNAGFQLVPDRLPLVVGQVDPSGPGAALAVGDQLVSIDGHGLQGMLPGGATIAIMNHHPGSTVTLGVARGGVTKTIAITLAE